MKQLGQWMAFIVLYAIGCMAFFIIAGEEVPQASMSLGKFVLFKVTAGLAIFACYKVGKVLYKKGYLPKCVESLVNIGNEED